MLEETDAAELVGGDFLNHGYRAMIRACGISRPVSLILFQPLGGGEERMGLVMGKEVADHLRAFCHEEPLTTAELLLFQLTDEFDLIFTDSHDYTVLFSH